MSEMRKDNAVVEVSVYALALTLNGLFSLSAAQSTSSIGSVAQ
ncbi:uncharacterized protein EKO05_0004058 [Ascochyta rabiei]|nr:uncharacterized protein EKO05_0004058 [Ascochyta rabiei]UPX13552.1 hypothetical protein EKO05_0004058 [Ascochyta rabiei]